MPTISTLAPVACAASVIASRFSRVLLSGSAAQRIIAAQLDDHDARLHVAQQGRQAAAATGRGVAADAGIAYLMGRFSALSLSCSRATQPVPAARPYSAEAVTHHDDLLPVDALRRRDP